MIFKIKYKNSKETLLKNSKLLNKKRTNYKSIIKTKSKSYQLSTNSNYLLYRTKLEKILKISIINCLSSKKRLSTILPFLKCNNWEKCKENTKNLSGSKGHKKMHYNNSTTISKKSLINSKDSKIKIISNH